MAGKLPVKIVSGGQTGADRAALDAALDRGIAVGGWCPKGRLAEDGPIDPRYPLKETPQSHYAERTQWNVRDSDATLIIARRPLTGGTDLTEKLARSTGKPCLVVHPDDTPDAAIAARNWVREHHIKVLNVAGPRQSTSGRAYVEARSILDRLLADR